MACRSNVHGATVAAIRSERHGGAAEAWHGVGCDLTVSSGAWAAQISPSRVTMAVAGVSR
jgi:hypothetical protein